MGELRYSSSGDEKSPSLQRINPISPFLHPTAWPLFWLLCIECAFLNLPITSCDILNFRYKRVHTFSPLPKYDEHWGVSAKRPHVTIVKGRRSKMTHYMSGVTYMAVLSASVKEATSWAAMPSPWDTRPKMDTHRILEQHVMLITHCLTPWSRASFRSQQTDTPTWAKWIQTLFTEDLSTYTQVFQVT